MTGADINCEPPKLLHECVAKKVGLHVKADLERELGRLVLHCAACGQRK